MLDVYMLLQSALALTCITKKIHQAPWNTALEDLIFAQVVKKFPALYVT
jgi:hypothetical protein